MRILAKEEIELQKMLCAQKHKTGYAQLIKYLLEKKPTSNFSYFHLTLSPKDHLLVRNNSEAVYSKETLQDVNERKVGKLFFSFISHLQRRILPRNCYRRKAGQNLCIDGFVAFEHYQKFNKRDVLREIIRFERNGREKRDGVVIKDKRDSVPLRPPKRIITHAHSVITLPNQYEKAFEALIDDSRYFRCESKEFQYQGARMLFAQIDQIHVNKIDSQTGIYKVFHYDIDPTPNNPEEKFANCFYHIRRPHSWGGTT